MAHPQEEVSRGIGMSGGPVKIILGGGEIHQIGIAAAAIVALEKGYDVEDMTHYRPGEGGEVPDLILTKRLRGWKKLRPIQGFVQRYRLEVIDSHDPVGDFTAEAARRGGYADIIKVFISKAETRCSKNHVGIPTRLELEHPQSHPLCIEALLEECRRQIP